MRKKERQGLEKKGGRGGRGGGIENANPAGSFPPFPTPLCLILSSMFMQNIELKELIRMYAEIGKCGA